MENTLHSDVRIDKDGEKFKFRVAGIVENKGKILIMYIEGNPFGCCPGGHVELNEDTKAAVARELSEELYFDVEVKDLLYIHENFFNVGSTKFHELCFYYKAVPKDKNISMDEITWEEIDKGQKFTHKFAWFDKDELLNQWVEPKVVFEKFLKGANKFEHFITKD